MRTSKTEYIKFGDFMRKENNEVKPSAVEAHFRKYGFAYKVVGTAVIIFATGGLVDAHAAGTAIDAGASKLYYEIIGVGKWIIIFKGAMDTIKSVGNGDFDGAKKHFFSYLLVYLLLLGLPYGMDKVDQVFRDLKTI